MSTQQYPMQPVTYQPVDAPIPTPFDFESPREPHQYRVPVAYRRPLGELPIDKRGRGWYLACASLVAVALSLFAPALSAGMPGVGLVPPIAALTMGIMALRRYSNSPKTAWASRTKTFSILGIVGGIFGILLALLILLISVLSSI